MCGIIGHYNFNKPVDRENFISMRDSLIHRGPDDHGANFFYNDRLALGHRRLSFLDLSDAGRQPMSNEDGTVWLVFNGEVYNYLELKEELHSAQHVFKTSTDTEVLIHGYETWGVQLFQKLKGMFVFAIVDMRKQNLYIVRDLFGIKPVYYYKSMNTFIFASELKAILKCKSFNKELDISAFGDFFTYQCIPEPKSIWKNTNKLSPGHYLTFDLKSHQLQIQQYKNFEFADKIISDDELIMKTGDILNHSVKIHARADVPIGSFLSGGYDTSAIVHYMTQNNLRPETFSVGLNEWDGTETAFADIVAKHLDVNLHAVDLDFGLEDVLQTTNQIYDEPFAYTSTYPTYQICKLASKKLKAVMGGDGADEIFCGYRGYTRLYNLLGKQIFHGNRYSYHHPEFDFINFYSEIYAMGKFDHGELKVLLNEDLHPHITEDSNWFYKQHFREDIPLLKSLQYLDIKFFLTELCIKKLDETSMANSLEVRVPFLDTDLFNMIFSLRGDQYFRPDFTKYPLYKNIEFALPPAIINRKKQGFVWPGRFYNQCGFYYDKLINGSLIYDGIINKTAIDNYLKHNEYWKLWKLTVMEYWWQKWMT